MRSNVGFDEDFLNALPEDVRREVEAQGMPSAAAQNQGPEMDFISVIAMTEDAGLRRDMLFQLNETMIRQLPQNLRREYDEARDEQARRHQDQMRREAERRERQRRDEERNRAFGGMHGMQQRRAAYRDEIMGAAEPKLDTIIENVERDIFDKQELPHYKSQAKIVER